MFEYIDSNVIGHLIPIQSPFGERPLVYADYTASGRSLRFIEENITEYVLSYYANTHTTTSWVGLQSGSFREEAREIIKGSVGADESDIVVFCGSGSTAAINKMIQIMKLEGLFHERSWEFNCKYCEKRFPTQKAYIKHLETNSHRNEINEDLMKPIVLLSPYEHHSNLLPWREINAVVITIKENSKGEVDLDDLRSQLEVYQHYPIKIGSFSAGSNITGILTDTVAVAKLLHSYNALAFFDFAACAPYVEIKMNSSESGFYDAVFISTHKFVGGPGTPGILIVKKDLMMNTHPVIPGGGTVLFVTNSNHQYTENLEEREEGGTPDIVGTIRAGLVFKLKSSVGEEIIHQRELELAAKGLERLGKHPRIELLANSKAERIPIFSFVIKYEDKYFHYDFVSRLLSDLFGIQVRGGCACAGPYAISLLNVSVNIVSEYTEVLTLGHILLKPGFTRLNFNYFMTEEVVDYILNAVEFVADNAI